MLCFLLFYLRLQNTQGHHALGQNQLPSRRLHEKLVALFSIFVVRFWHQPSSRRVHRFATVPKPNKPAFLFVLGQFVSDMLCRYVQVRSTIVVLRYHPAYTSPVKSHLSHRYLHRHKPCYVLLDYALPGFLHRHQTARVFPAFRFSIAMHPLPLSDKFRVLPKYRAFFHPKKPSPFGCGFVCLSRHSGYFVQASQLGLSLFR